MAAELIMYKTVFNRKKKAKAERQEYEEYCYTHDLGFINNYNKKRKNKQLRIMRFFRKKQIYLGMLLSAGSFVAGTVLMFLTNVVPICIVTYSAVLLGLWLMLTKRNVLYALHRMRH